FGPVQFGLAPQPLARDGIMLLRGRNSQRRGDLVSSTFDPVWQLFPPICRAGSFRFPADHGDDSRPLAASPFLPSGRLLGVEPSAGPGEIVTLTKSLPRSDRWVSSTSIRYFLSFKENPTLSPRLTEVDSSKGVPAAVVTLSQNWPLLTSMRTWTVPPEPGMAFSSRRMRVIVT